MRKYNGAISLFMIIITMTCFIFGGVFIDASRIIVAKNKVRNAMNSALRSSVSYYDKKLVGDYGLYGCDITEAQQNFSRYFAQNMITEDDTIKMFEYNIINSNISGNTPISDSAEFKRQVVEYSKYRAPVTTTMILIDKVKDVFLNLKKGADKIGESTDALEDFKEQFENDANQVKVGLRSAKETVSQNIKDVVRNNIDQIKEGGDVTAIRNAINEQFSSMYDAFDTSEETMNKMQRDTENYRSQATDDINAINEINVGDEADAGLEEDRIPKADGEQTDIAQQADNKTGENGSMRTEVSNMKSAVDAIKSRVDALVVELGRLSGNLVVEKNRLAQKQQEFQTAERDYDEKKRILNQTGEKIEAYNNAKEIYDRNEDKVIEYNEKIESARIAYADNTEFINAINTYINPLISNDYDSKNPKTSENNIRSALKNAYPELSQVFSNIDSLNTAVANREQASKAMANSGGESLSSAYNSAQAAKNQAENTYNAKKGERDAQQAVVDGVVEDIDGVKRSIDAEMDNLKNVMVPSAPTLNIVDIAKDKITKAIKDVDLINSLNELYNSLNREMQTYTVSAIQGDSADSKMHNGIIKKIKGICDYAKDMFKTFTEWDRFRDNIYMVDYIMDKCTYLTSKTPRNHYFEKGEVEYIIFGQKSQVGNIAAAVTTITLMRFAINFIDYFIKAPGDLIAKAVYALGRGAARTYLDMRNMLIAKPAEGVGICPSFDSLKLTYSDHLRLLLFFKFSNAQEGLKDTIYTNMEHTLSGGNINELYTRMTADVEVEVNMLILPIFFGEFTGTNFRNGNYVIRDKATLGY